LPFRANCGKPGAPGKPHPHKVELEDGMADHGTVEYATATGNDLAAHENMYESFVHLAFVGTLAVINILLGLAIGAVTDHWLVGGAVIVVSLLVAARGLATGARASIAVMTLLSLLALAVTA
jgi:hypothetical protein